MVNVVLRNVTNQNGTDQRKTFYGINRIVKCTSYSREVITAIYSLEEYANLATIFIIIINNYLFKKRIRCVFFRTNACSLPSRIRFSGATVLGYETITDT